jgi:hypothetical protein
MRQSFIPQTSQLGTSLPAQSGQISQPMYGQPLFPLNMFPSFSQYPIPVQQEKSERPERRETGDETMELVALLALLKIAFG